MKKRLFPSGEYCGLMCLPCVNGEKTLTWPVATSIVASWRGENTIFVKSVVGPRSVANAIVFPSGDHAGWMSALRSFVSCRTVPAARSSRYRSLMPPAIPENAIVCPFGDQAMCVTEPTPGTRTRRSMLAEATSRIAISWLPSAWATNANLRLSGDQAPDVLMKLIASKCESLVGPASFLITRPVVASATNSSISNRLRRA